jgi:hypothetical protein
LIEKYNAPDFTWRTLRRTCAWNMPGANPYAAARRAGRSVAVAESFYVDLVKVPPQAKALEAAMQIEAEVERLIAAVGGYRKRVEIEAKFGGTRIDAPSRLKDLSARERSLQQ